MFEHEDFDKYSFEEIPLDRDLYMMDEIYLKDYEKSFLEFFNENKKDYQNVGYVSFIAARKIHKNSMELSFYGDTTNRFHEISINLNKENFVCCVGSYTCDEKPHIFVKSEWLANIYMKFYAIFSLIDMVDVKKALENNTLNREKLVEFRDKIDILSSSYPNISFVSYADNIILKSNWSLNFKNNQKYNYEPEVFLKIINEIKMITKNVLDLNIYAVVTQGSNEYYNDSLLYISKSGNHISLNSLGIPFAQLKEIEDHAKNLKLRSELYLDKQYFYSLKYKLSFKKSDICSYTYYSKILDNSSRYYCTTLDEIIDDLELK